MATPEKALLDVLYLSSTKTRLFAALPELDLSAGFSIRNARKAPAPHPVTTPSNHGGKESSRSHEILPAAVSMRISPARTGDIALAG